MMKTQRLAKLHKQERLSRMNGRLLLPQLSDSLDAELRRKLVGKAPWFIGKTTSKGTH